MLTASVEQLSRQIPPGLAQGASTLCTCVADSCDHTCFRCLLTCFWKVALQEERHALGQQAAQLESHVAALKEEAGQFSANDPERFEALSACGNPAPLACVLPSVHTAMIYDVPLADFSHSACAEQATLVARDSANRWTDNIFTLQSWMRKKFPGMEGQLASFFKEVSSRQNTLGRPQGALQTRS